MTYYTGATSNSTNPAKDFSEGILHPKLLAAGFTYVEEVATSYPTRIYKSASATNGVGDWYLVVFRRSATSQYLNFGVCEEYDSGTHIAKKWAPNTATSGQTLPADRSHYTTAGIPADQVAGWQDATTAHMYLGTSAHTYVLSINAKRIVGSTKVSSTETVFYSGLYQPYLPGVANHFPLVTSGVGGQYGYGATLFTREPGTGLSVGSVGGDWGNNTFTTGQSFQSGWPQLTPTPGVDGYLLKPLVSPVLVPPSQGKIAGYRGQAYGVYASAAAFSWGDIANIDWNGTPVTATCIYGNGAPNRLIDQAF